MIGQLITDKDGQPIDSQGKKLTESSYSPSEEIKRLFARVQTDYQISWALQHRPFDEFDGYSLLDRARLDQQTFAAFVGTEYVPAHKRWRWKGRKNTARNKLIGILAHMLAGMLFPFVNAQNEENQEDKMTARVMRILVEEHLKKAGYEIKFLFMITSALVNPAVFCEVSYVTAFQRIKHKMKDGKIKVLEAVDELLSGVNLNIIPIDEILLGDFYTFDLQRQPVIFRVRRISWDEARKIHANKCYDENGKDLFDYVEAGKTRVVMAGQDNYTLFDVDWTEADGMFVQELTAYYRDEDLEVVFVGGIFMGEQKDVYNHNPFKHRRLTLLKNEWISAPVYPFAKSGFEPLDPAGRFAYYKSGAFKEYWDALGEDRMHQIAYDGTYLDVIKPMFLSGVSKIDGTVMIPGATIGMPTNATATPYQLGPNLTAAIAMMNQQKTDMSESTQDKVMEGKTTPGITATQTNVAVQQAKIFLGVFGILVADLVKQVGELTMDCIIQHTTTGEVDAMVPEALRMKYKSMVSKGKEKGRDITNKIVFSDYGMGRDLSEDDIKKRQWKLFFEAGGENTNQRIYEVNPYKFARNKFSMTVDADQIILKSMGMDRNQKILAFQMMSDPRVAPFTDPEAVANDFVIEEFAEGDPDRYKKKPSQQPDLMQAVMGNNASNGQQNGEMVVSPATSINPVL